MGRMARHGPLSHTTLPPTHVAQTTKKTAVTTRQGQGGGASRVARRAQIARLHEKALVGAGAWRRQPNSSVYHGFATPNFAARATRQFHTRIPLWGCKAVELARRLRACSGTPRAAASAKFRTVAHAPAIPSCTAPPPTLRATSPPKFPLGDAKPSSLLDGSELVV